MQLLNRIPAAIYAGNCVLSKVGTNFFVIALVANYMNDGLARIGNHLLAELDICEQPKSRGGTSIR